jgi:hypothetical protein
LIYFKKFKMVQDSVSNGEFTRKIVQLQNQFESAVLENKLGSAQKELEMKQSRLTTNRYGLIFGTIAVILFIALILVIISGRNRAKYLQEQLDYYVNNQFQKK